VTSSVVAVQYRPFRLSAEKWLQLGGESSIDASTCSTPSGHATLVVATMLTCNSHSPQAFCTAVYNNSQSGTSLVFVSWV